MWTGTQTAALEDVFPSYTAAVPSIKNIRLQKATSALLRDIPDEKIKEKLKYMKRVADKKSAH